MLVGRPCSAQARVPPLKLRTFRYPSDCKTSIPCKEILPRLQTVAMGWLRSSGNSALREAISTVGMLSAPIPIRAAREIWECLEQHSCQDVRFTLADKYWPPSANFPGSWPAPVNDRNTNKLKCLFL